MIKWIKKLWRKLMTWLVDADVTEPLISTGVVASGGTESTIRVGGQLYRLHKFTGDGNFDVSTAGKVECLLVGGGGAGGQTVGTYAETEGVEDWIFVVSTGGGGGGGVVRANLDLQSTGRYVIAVGSGGQIDTTLDPDEAPSNTSDLDGNDSVIFFGEASLLRAKGGGGGAINQFPVTSANFDGRNGASSGGGSARVAFDTASSGFLSSVLTDAGASIFGQGRSGASGGFTQTGPGTLDGFSFGIGGGGGGAFSAGKIIDTLGAGDPLLTASSGGDGVQSDITGTIEYYGGGGGGSIYAVDFGGQYQVSGAGGLGGGGDGASFVASSQSGADGFGGGGGCGQTIFTLIDDLGVESNQASNGGSGVVIIRYPIEG